MNRGNSLRQSNGVTSRSQPRSALSFPSKMSDAQHQKSKGGLPYIPSTPSTRSSSSHSGTSFGRSFDEKDAAVGEREQYDYDDERLPVSRKEIRSKTNSGRSESPTKRNNQGSTYKSTHRKTIDSSNASQSTSSTSSSQRQLIVNVKSSSSVSTFGSSGSNGQHRPVTHHPDSVEEEHTGDYNDTEEETSLDENDIEEDTVHTQPMIRYKTAPKTPQQRRNQEEVEEDEEVGSSQFLNESFDTIDFGSTTGVAPPGTYQPQQLHYQNEDDHYADEYNYENDDDADYYEDQELLYENSDGNVLEPEYDEDAEEYYEGEGATTEEEQLRRAVRRGSALACSSGGGGSGYVSSNSINQNHQQGQYAVDRKQRPTSLRTESTNQNYNSNDNNPSMLHRQPQPQAAAVRRQQISRSMASKRHLIAASARGVVATRVSNNNLDVEFPPVSSKQRAINSEIQQQHQQRQRVMKTSSYGDIERPPPQQQQPRRGSVTKASSHDMTFLSTPPLRSRTQPQHSTRASNTSNRGGTSDWSDGPATITPPPLRPSVRRAPSSRRMLEEDMSRQPSSNQQLQMQQRSSVSKAASYGAISSQSQKPARRNSVTKATSHNGYFEPAPSPPELQPPARGMSYNMNSIGRRNDPSKSMLQRPPPPASSRRRSLEHVPTQSFRSNHATGTPELRYAHTNQTRLYQHSSGGDDDYDEVEEEEDDHRITYVDARPPSSTTRRSQRSNSMDSTTMFDKLHLRDIPTRNYNNNNNSNHDDDERQHYRQQSELHDVSFSDLAARRF